jgi:hypothetical protein
MLIYINSENEYPRFPGDIQVNFPEWEIGDALPEGWIEVEDALSPQASATEKAIEVFPKEVDGKYIRSFEVVPLTEEEIAEREAPATAKARLESLGFTEAEITAIAAGLVR